MADAHSGHEQLCHDLVLSGAGHVGSVARCKANPGYILKRSSFQEGLWYLILANLSQESSKAGALVHAAGCTDDASLLIEHELTRLSTNHDRESVRRELVLLSKYAAPCRSVSLDREHNQSSIYLRDLTSEVRESLGCSKATLYVLDVKLGRVYWKPTDSEERKNRRIQKVYSCSAGRLGFRLSAFVGPHGAKKTKASADTVAESDSVPSITSHTTDEDVERMIAAYMPSEEMRQIAAEMILSIASELKSIEALKVVCSSLLIVYGEASDRNGNVSRDCNYSNSNSADKAPISSETGSISSEKGSISSNQASISSGRFCIKMRLIDFAHVYPNDIQIPNGSTTVDGRDSSAPQYLRDPVGMAEGLENLGHFFSK